MKPLFLIPVNLKDEIDLFIATKERVESSLGVELGIEAIEIYSEKEIDSRITKLSEGEDVFDYDALDGLKICEIHSIFQRPDLSSLVLKNNQKYIQHSIGVARQILDRTKNRNINVNSHLSYFISAEGIKEFKGVRSGLLQNIVGNYKAVTDLLSGGVSLTVENMDNSRWFRTDDKLALMPLDTSFWTLDEIRRNVGSPRFGMCLDVAHHQLNQRLPDLLSEEEKRVVVDCFSLNSFSDFAGFVGSDEYLESLVKKGFIKSMHVSNFKGINILKTVNEHGTVEGLLDFQRARQFIMLAQKLDIPVTLEVPMDPIKARKAGFFESPCSFLNLLGY
jgi:hypothetical protein